MLERACNAVASYLGFRTCCGSCSVNASFLVHCTRVSPDKYTDISRREHTGIEKSDGGKGFGEERSGRKVGDPGYFSLLS